VIVRVFHFPAMTGGIAAVRRGECSFVGESYSSAMRLAIMFGDKSEKAKVSGVYAGNMPRLISYLKAASKFSKTDNGLFIGLPVRLCRNVGLALKLLPC
jgi:hypothetical protein